MAVYNFCKPGTYNGMGEMFSLTQLDDVNLNHPAIRRRTYEGMY